MSEQKSQAAQLLRQISLEYQATAQVLTGVSVGSAIPSSLTAKVEQIGACHEQLARVITTLIRYCKARLSRVQYNIDVVKCIRKLQVLDAV
jgi:hypothetical protein